MLFIRSALLYLVFVGVLATHSHSGEISAEPDKRLHADGSQWGLQKAPQSDRDRPRILLIGDSILAGYRARVVDALAEKAYVDVWINPYYQSAELNQRLADVLRGGPYDVVHFNMGLHGWVEGRIKPGTFESLTEAYVQVLRKELPHARLIWASTTPVTTAGTSPTLHETINPVIVDHNRRAAQVMKRLGVPINDLYCVLVDNLDWARGDQFHWKTEAYTQLADQVVQAITAQLPPKADEKIPPAD